MAQVFKNPNQQVEQLLSSDIIYRYPHFNENVPQGKVRLYHQTTLPKLKEIMKSGFIKGDVWSQENINPDQWRYGDIAIAFDVDPKVIHKANDTDRIIYNNIPIDAFSHIKARTSRTPKGIESFKKELENGNH